MKLIQPFVSLVVLAISVWSVFSFSADEDQRIPHTSQDTNASPETAKSEPQSDEAPGAGEQRTPYEQADSGEELARLQKERLDKLEDLVASLKAHARARAARSAQDIRDLHEAEQQLLKAKLSSEAVAANRIRLIDDAIKDLEGHVRTLQGRRDTETPTMGLSIEVRMLELRILLAEQKMLEAKQTKQDPHGSSDLNTATADAKTQPHGGSDLDPELRDLLQQRRDVLRQQVAASKARQGRELENFNDHLNILKTLVDVELELATSAPERQQACERYVKETEFLLAWVESRVSKGFGESDSVNSLKAAVLDAKILRARHKSKPPQQ